MALGLDVLGVDLFPMNPPDHLVECIQKALSISVDSFAINELWDDYFATKDHKALTTRAWISSLVAEACLFKVSATAKIDTKLLRERKTNLLCRMYTEIATLEGAKSRLVENDFSAVEEDKDGNIVIYNSRYKTRVKRSKKTKIVMIDERNREHHGRVEGVSGKKSVVQPLEKVEPWNIRKINIMGKEGPTNAENARDDFVLRVLQGKRMLNEYAFIRRIWLPNTKKRTCHPKVTNAPILAGRLNQSQANVVEAMTGTDTSLIIVHGPPGTGKTSVISAAADIWERMDEAVWIVAQSNVGVKNIAKSLFKHDVPFKLIVAQEFYFVWHEHIYEEIFESVIRSDQHMGLLLKDTRVVLCTLGMLSNPMLHNYGVFKDVPHLFGKFKYLQKVCFFGDPKQLPPYGRTEVSDSQCIFDIKHLQSQSYFLDTQYRLPSPLGSFISSSVYDNGLRSVHQIGNSSCLSLINVNSGLEEAVGKSWKNAMEVQVIGHLVDHYYRNKEFCVITPYDAQRNAIQQYPKNNNLPFENVFNVDSFQGNESDYVLVSVVRTNRPGFLKSMERVNVMLTRCKLGMVIVTNKAFMHSEDVKMTLLGKLGAHWEKMACKRGGHDAWEDWRAVCERRCDLPGAKGVQTELEEYLLARTQWNVYGALYLMNLQLPVYGM